MAQEVAIAKAALAASLFRSDPNPLPRAAVETLFQAIDTAVNECSHQNVQTCSRWIKANIAPSDSRTGLLGRYLFEYSKGLEANKGQKPSLKRRRLHVLYLMSDVMWHATGIQEEFFIEKAWPVQLPALLALAGDFTNCPKHIEKLEGLIGLWEKRGHFTSGFVEKLRKGLTEGIDALDTASEHVSAALKREKEAPWVIPKLHGDPSAKWYDQPAATWLPHMVPGSTKPMKPSDIVPLELTPGPAPEHLITAVKKLLSDVEILYKNDGKTEDGSLPEIGEMGERIVLDEVTGEIVDGDTYYGWSRAFCEKMQERKRKAKEHPDSKSRSRSRSRSQQSEFSRGRSPSPRLKRRRNDSQTPPPRRSRPRSHSRDDRQSHRRSYSRSRSRSHSRSRQNTSYQHRPPPPPNENKAFPPPPPAPYPQFPSVPPPGEFPIPPPPPIGYTGPWPPVPPAPHMGGQPPQNWFPGGVPPPPPPHMMGGWGSAPPPSVNYNQHQGNHHHGRGNGWNRGRGRGYRGNRGGW